MSRRIFPVLTLLLFLAAPALALESKAKQLIVLDYNTGATIMSREADTPMHPASMTKMMTAHLIFKGLKEGKLSMEQTFKVSEKAWRMQGSKMFVELGADIPLSDLLRGIVIQSGNDACIVVAEGMAGTEATFAKLMTDEAKAIGMTKTSFLNSTGWPDENHLTTARDLAILAMDTIRNYSEYYPIYAEEKFTWHGIPQYNRNLLLGGDLGVDGLKTGHTEVSGYGITVSAVNKDGRRVIAVVNGLSSEKERAEEAAALVGYAFGAFENMNIAKTKLETTIPVWFGALDTVGVMLPEQASVTLPRAGRDTIRFTVVADAPVAAPVKKGQEIGRLRITAPGMDVQTLPLLAAAEVPKAGFMRRIVLNLKHL